MANITLAGIGNIHTDSEGRYSLNDFHKAAGGEERHGPKFYMATQQAQDLAQILSDGGIPPSVIRGGRNQGTYVPKEMVYAYAMWISAPFQLKVIRAFDALVTGDIEQAQHIASSRQVPPAKLFPDYFRIAKLIGCDRNAAAISANNAVFKKTGENVLALLGHTHIEAEKQELVFNVSDLVDGISGQRMNKMLEAAGLQHREGERWIPDDDGEFSRIYDAGKKHSDGTPVQQIRWSRRVLDLLSIGTAA